MLEILIWILLILFIIVGVFIGVFFIYLNISKKKNGLVYKRWLQLKDYMEKTKKEMKMPVELVKRYKERKMELSEYEEFKKSFIYVVDDYFENGKSKIVIKPRKDYVDYFNRLYEDENLNRYYNLNLRSGNQLEVTLKGFD